MKTIYIYKFSFIFVIYLQNMKQTLSPKVKRLGPTKMTSPDRYVVTGQTQKNFKPTSSRTVTSTGIRKPVSPQNSVKRIKSNQKQVKIIQSTKKQSSKEQITIEELKLNYEGDTLDGKFHGYGTLSDPSNLDTNSYIYRGEWKNGSRQGKGHYIYPDRSEYNGEWVNNMKHGWGTYKNDQGDFYEGQWYQNQRHGKGTLSLRNGIVLDGRWLSGNFLDGKCTYPNGHSYQGGMQNYRRKGKGIYQYGKYADKFEGQYSGNIKQGYGKYIYKNGDTFQGNFHNNLRQGRNCKYVWSSGRYQLNQSQFIGDKPIHGNLFDRSQSKNIKTF